MGRFWGKILDFGFLGPWSLLFKVLDAIFPNNPRLTVFGSNHGLHFSDNSKALFIHFIEEMETTKPIWITRSKDVFKEIESEYPGHVVMSFSLRGVYTFLRASQIVISHSYLDMCLFPYTRSKTVNYLWHGVPIRRIGRMIEQGESEATDRMLLHWSRWNGVVDYFFASSEYEARIMKKAFRLGGMKCEITGYPRNDVLHIEMEKAEIGNNGNSRIILYAPTYRLTSQGDRAEKIPIMHPSLLEEEVHEFLESRNSRLIIRPHPSVGEINFSSERIECLTVNEEPDLANLFIRADILVTDYSSAYFDWLMMDKPVIFSVYDLEKYRKEIGFIDELENIAAGKIASSESELLEHLTTYLEDPLVDSERRAEIRALVGIVEGKSCERIAEVILKESNRPV